jgi:phage shock protein PspC (stress-responsive transcriptional regulator)
MSEGNRNMANSTLDRIRRRISLDSREGWIAGVCAGFARYLDTDPAFVRVAVIISALFMPKVTAAAYLIAWLVLDDERKL